MLRLKKEAHLNVEMKNAKGGNKCIRMNYLS